MLIGRRYSHRDRVNGNVRINEWGSVTLNVVREEVSMVRRERSREKAKKQRNKERRTTKYVIDALRLFYCARGTSVLDGNVRVDRSANVRRRNNYPVTLWILCTLNSVCASCMA